MHQLRQTLSARMLSDQPELDRSKLPLCPRGRISSKSQDPHGPCLAYIILILAYLDLVQSMSSSNVVMSSQYKLILLTKVSANSCFTLFLSVLLKVQP